MTVNFYLARHGQTQWNKAQRYQGQLDSELTLLGKQQPKEVALQLSDKRIDFIMSSPLGRSVASAEICKKLLHVPVVIDDGLMERHLGEWQGQFMSIIKDEEYYHQILHQYTDVSPPHGESAIQCGTRLYKTLTSCTQKYQNKNILVIVHGEALRCLLAELGNHMNGNAYQLFDNGCLVQLAYTSHNNSFQLVR